MKLKKIPLHWRIILGMFLGVIFATLALEFSFGKALVINWIKPFGNIFINSLKLIAIPLIFVSLIKGVSDLKDISKLSIMGFKTILIYLCTTILAISIGIIAVNIIEPGNSVSEETQRELIKNYGVNANQKILVAEEEKEKGPLNALENIVPSNLFKAASGNENMLQIIFFAIFFGICLILIPEKKAKPVKDFFDGFNDAILKMIDLIMIAAPFGVFSLLATLVVEAPGWDLFVALGQYALTVVLGLLCLLIIYLGIIYIYVKIKPSDFLKAMSPAQLLAFSTSSSAATLPVTIERVEEELHVDEDVSSFVLPIGATINMDGTSLYQAVAAIFIAQSFGMALDFQTQLGIIITATLASIGSAAVPGAGMVMLVIVLTQAGIPEVGLALIFAVDRPLDMCRTTINVTGDAMVCSLIAKSENKINPI